MENSPDHSNKNPVVLKIICRIVITLSGVGFFGWFGTFVLNKFSEQDEDILCFLAVLVFAAIIGLFIVILIIYIIYNNRKTKEMVLKYLEESQKSNNEVKIYENIAKISPNLTEDLLKANVDNLYDNKKQNNTHSNNNEDIAKIGEVLLIIKETLDKMFPNKE